jgi:hypothetical protein
VPADGADLGYTETALEQTGDCLVPKVMKVKIRHLCASAEALKG